MDNLFFWIIIFITLYIVIFAAVKEAIDKSEVGKILIKKYGDKKTVKALSDEEIEKELEDDRR